MGTYFAADFAYAAAEARHHRAEELAEAAEEAGFDDPYEYQAALDEDAAEARAEQAREDRCFE